MDVNGTRFHLTLTEAEWLPPAETLAGVEARAAFELTDGTLHLRRLPPRLPATGGATAPPLGRGAAADRYGNVYWIALAGDEIRFLGADWSASQRFWPPPDGAGCSAPVPERGDFMRADPPSPVALELAGIAVTAEHYLVVGTQSPAGLLIFDLYGGGAPMACVWPATVPFAPADLSPTDDGGLWVLDRQHRTLWRLDRSLRVIPAIPPVAAEPVFTPAVGATSPGSTCAVDPVWPGSALGLPGAVDPVAVQSLPDGSVLVLDNDPATDHSVVRRYRDGLPAGVRALDHDLVEAFDGGGLFTLRLRGRDMVFAPGPVLRSGVRGTIYVAAMDDRQVFGYELTATPDDFDLQLASRLYPLRAVAEHGLVRSRDRVRYGFDDRWLLVAEFPDARYKPEGKLELPAGGGAFDGHEPGCVWHRLLVDGWIPGDAEVVVESRAADDPALLPVTPWQREPRPYRRGDGAELPFYGMAVDPSERCRGTWELLFQNARGRYLQLRLTLQGRGRTTPRLQALRVYYPRFSYLERYLPAVYRHDPGSAAFLDRYLANVEGIYTTLEGRVAETQVLFDTRVTPAAYLPWLASWFGVGLEAAWSERTARLFLAHASQMFSTRGTPCGVVRAIRLALEPCVDESVFAQGGCTHAAFGVRVVERYRLRQAPGVVFGDPTDLLGPGSTTDVSEWKPVQGAEPLHRQFRTYLADRYGTISSLGEAWSASFSGFDDPSLRLSALRPSGERGRDWQTFIQAVLGFTYAVPTDDDEPLFREYLARRYPQVSDLNRSWGLEGAAALSSFADLKPRVWDGVLRSDLPADGSALRDWIAFVSQVLPTARNAHRFTVLVPVGLADSPAEQIRKRGLADRIVEMEKPAHTQHEVRLYWGAFRVGEARVGLETVVANGSRSAALMLGRDLLGAAHLGFSDAARMPDRLVLSGDTPGCPAPSAICLRN